MYLELKLVLAIFISVASPFKNKDISKSTHLCDNGDTIQNGRVTCTCTHRNVYECQLRKYTDLLDNQKDDKTGSLACQPKKVYVQDTTTCICNSNGSWPHKACGEIFDFLPSISVVKTKCEPNGYVILDCNVCRCDSEGLIDKDRCTKNECDGKETARRRSSNSKNVYGNCEAKNWYSLAPCQFCYCINENKLVCNTGIYFDKRLSLGTYNLSVCGKELIREAIELIPEDDQALRDGEAYITAEGGNSKHKTTNRISSTTIQTTPLEAQIDVLVEINNKNKNLQNELDFKTEKVNLNKEESEPEAKEWVDREGDYSDSEEKVGNEVASRMVESTRIPYEEIRDDYQIYSKESKDESIEEDKEMKVQLVNREHRQRGLKIPVTASPSTKSFIHFMSSTSEVPSKAMMDPFEHLGKKLTENLPFVLSKVFNMALRRKSFVTIDKREDCVAGAINVDKCNTCFCLKNNKMLCTNKKC